MNPVSQGTYRFQADDLNLDYLESAAFKEDGRGLRGSIMIVGPLLARFGRGYIPKPGGDKIGRRRLDTHFEGFINWVRPLDIIKKTILWCRGQAIERYLYVTDEASVTGTANIVMAAVLAEGTTTI